LTENQIISNSLSLNGDHGLELKGALNTTVEGNTIEENLENGIYLSEGAKKSQIIRNILRSNGGQAIRANREETMGNTWSQNKIYNNQSDGIMLTSGANEGIEAPLISTILSAQVIGRAKANSTVELFSDNALQGGYFEGYTTADSAGTFTFVNPSGWQGANITAIATDSAGNSSAFASHKIALENLIYLPLISQ
jgi:parallel beta-helix repeat protein